ncbi:MAG: AMP-binding protein [Tetrasphaera sp.]
MINPLALAKAIVTTRLVGPALPHRYVGQLAALAWWGFGLVGEAAQAARIAPNAVAVDDEDAGEITYAELLDRAARVAVALRERGAGPGVQIGMLARNHVGALEVMLGASMLGADLVLCNTGLSAPQLAEVARRQALTLLVHDDEFAAVVGGLPQAVARLGEGELGAAAAALPRGTGPGRPARAGRTIILTSGTTGTPKGAVRRNPGGIGPLVSIVDKIPLRAGETVLVSAPIFHTWGYAAIQLCLTLHARIVLRRRFTPEAAATTLLEAGCQVMFAVPVMLQRMLEQLPAEPAGRFPKLRIVATSGSAYPHGFATRFMDRFGDVLYNLYGSTEVSWVCIATPTELRRNPDSVGTPPHGTVVTILDDDGHEVAPGEVGRIFAGNSMVFDGYTAGSGKPMHDGLIDTGDLGHIEDGLYVVDGRADDMIVSGGENVYPAEVESALLAHPAVREACVIGVPDEEYGQRLAAFVVLRDGARLTADDVRDQVRAQRARHCIPRDVVFLPELPRNATGKVLARELGRRL